jgi:AraC-like DNA-binding protein
MEIRIKNMVCPRCLEAVKNSLDEVHIAFDKLELGRVYLAEALTPIQKEALSKSLFQKGFELLESKSSALISQIKTLIIEQIHQDGHVLEVNFSTFLREKLEQDYSSMSRLFSQVEGITIEKYITRQKIERVKTLLFYDQLSLSQIALKLQYSSVAYLSSQFKKETGMTPTEFRQTHSGTLKSLDQL